MGGSALERVVSILDLVRERTKLPLFAEVVSENNFPTGAGIASSAAAFAALSLAASTAAGLNLSEAELSRLARRGSGSAARSIPGGFVEWQAGETDQDRLLSVLPPPILLGSGGPGGDRPGGRESGRFERGSCPGMGQPAAGGQGTGCSAALEFLPQGHPGSRF